MDYTKFLTSEVDVAYEEPENTTEPVETTDEVTEDTQEDNRIHVDGDTIREFCERFSGHNEKGETKAILSYQEYDYENEDSGKDSPIHTLDKATDIRFSYDKLNPQVAWLDVCFGTYTERELSLMWARINQWRRSKAEIPVLLIHLLERESINPLSSEENDTLLECKILNPLMAILMRETPTTVAQELRGDIPGEAVGGNMIRFLINMELTTFEVSNDIDTQQIKTDVAAELEDARYLENVEANGTPESF